MMDKKANGGNFWRFSDYVEEVSQIVNQNKLTLKFATIKAMLKAAKDIVNLFDNWEKQNLVCLDNLKTSFYFDMQSGELDFRSKNMIVGYGYQASGNIQIDEMTASEIINGSETTYNVYTQRWKLAVVLFEFFYHNDGPYKGADSMMRVYYSKDEEYQWMAKEGIFNMEDEYCKNHTVHGVQDRLNKYWWYFPEILRVCFTQTFVSYKENPQGRFSAYDWKIILNQVESEYIDCICGKKGFAEEFLNKEKRQHICPRCGRNFYRFTDGCSDIYLSTNTIIKKKEIYSKIPDDDTPFGIVVENTKQKGLFGIKNISNEGWLGKYPNGDIKEIVPGGGIPIWQGQ